MKCPKCHFDNPADTSFCGKCGTQIQPLSAEFSGGPTETLKTPIRELATSSIFAGRYQVIEELGHGGMGKVYKVYDTDIKEKIALKLLRPEIGLDKETVERFSNELKLARRISHRNVCRMFDLGKSEGTTFITMEFVAGEDLKSMIHMSGSLSLGMLLSVGKQVCDGLAEAHGLGIVHRDLKPQNIMIDKNGNAKIMDFGIARSVREKGITGPSIMIGTPEYMSPEQAEAKDVDQRSDIYSLGVILYEMATRHTPFTGETALSIAMKHKGETPKSPRGINPDIPADLSFVILKCLEKDKANRFQSASDLRRELDRIEKGLPTTDRVAPSRISGTSKEITVSFSLKRWVVPLAAVAVLVILGIGVWRLLLKKGGQAAVVGKPTIAVLPFEDRNRQEGSADLCRETMIGIYDKLTRLGKFDVKSRFLVKDYEKTEKGPLTIGRELGVSYVLVGSMYIGGGKFSADVELLNVRDGSRIWNRTIPGIFGDILSVQGEIAEDVVTGLQLKLSLEEKNVLKRRPTDNAEAFRAYSIGRGFYARRTAENIHKAIEYYEQAIRLDPAYALAYSGLADAYTSLYDARAREAAARAIALDDGLAEAHTSLANAKLELDWDWKGAEEAFKRALVLDPNYPLAHHWYGRLLIMLGRRDQSIAEIEFARKLDPTDIVISRNLGFAYLSAGQTDRAIRQLQEAFKMDPDFPEIKNLLCIAYFEKSMFQDILELYNHNEKEWPVKAIRLLELAKYDRIKALKALDELLSRTQGFFSAWAFTLFGEREKVLSNLERAYKERDPNIEYLKVAPFFNAYRSDPRIQDLLKRMRLD